MKIELKPCPFCDAKASVVEGGINGQIRTYGLVEHERDCWFVFGLPYPYQHILVEEFDAWNRRASD